jgi:hypothetical protein
VRVDVRKCLAEALQFVHDDVGPNGWSRQAVLGTLELFVRKLLTSALPIASGFHVVAWAPARGLCTGPWRTTLQPPLLRTET